MEDIIFNISDTERIIIRKEKDYITVSFDDGENDQYATIVFDNEKLDEFLKILNALNS